MDILVILAHPDSGSFNHAIAGTVLDALKNNKHNVFFHDLYKEGFPPLLPADEIPSDCAHLPPIIAKHCAELRRAGGIVVIHPNWWGQPPAVLKGWIDRIVRPGVAYRFKEGDGGEGVPEGLLAARSAIVFNTSNTSAPREDSVFGDPLESIWKDCIFGLCGVKDFHRRMFRIVVTSSLEERKCWLAETAELVNAQFPAIAQ